MPKGKKPYFSSTASTPHPKAAQISPTKEPRPPNFIVESITKQATIVREAAAELTTRIGAFERYLSSIPGRVETEYFGQHPESTAEDQGNYFLVLKLHRDGKEWIL